MVLYCRAVTSVGFLGSKLSIHSIGIQLFKLEWVAFGCTVPDSQLTIACL